MLRVGVIGLGDISKVHIPVILNNLNAELIAVCDHDEEALNLDLNANKYLDYHEMLKKEELDVVHICLPHFEHVQVAMDLIEAGVAVFLEKPMGLNSEEAVKLQAFIDERQAKVCICLQNRLNETIEALKVLQRTKNVGALKSIKGLVCWARTKEYYDAKPWRGKMATAGGGVMINQSIHTLDLMQYFGGEIASLKGSISQILDYGIEVEDTASVKIDFASGATGLFYATIANGKNTNVELEVDYENASYLIQDCCLYQVDKDGSRIKLCEDAKFAGSKFYYGASHAKCIGEFYEALLLNHDHYIHAREGLIGIQMIDAIRESSDKKLKIQFKEEK